MSIEYFKLSEKADLFIFSNLFHAIDSQHHLSYQWQQLCNKNMINNRRSELTSFFSFSSLFVQFETPL